MTTDVDVSVVVCTYNRSELLTQTLRSLTAMQLPDALRWELCVVDNNSPDATPAVVEACARAHPTLSIRRVLERQAGIAFARNAGVTNAAGHVIAFVDDDVLVDPGWLAVIARSFAADPTLDILGGRLEANPEVPPPDWLASINTAPLGLINYGAERKRIDFPYLATANCAFKRSAVIDAGMFDVRLGRRPDKLYADEDTEMVSRILARGGRVEYEPAMLAFHFVPAARMTKDYFRRWYQERGEGSGLVGAESGRSLFGIPFFEFRQCLVSLGGYIAKTVRRKQKFQEELFLRHFFGIVTGRVRRLTGKA